MIPSSAPHRLLFITQKLHGQDSFGVLWVNAFRKRGYEVTVLCLERQLGEEFPFEVISMGKERGVGKAGQIINFLRFIITLRYDRVFIHMSPVWMTLGWWVWLLRRIPVYLWYTHYKMQLGVRLFMLFGKRAFCATAQSLPQYPQSPKKIVTGHGIDLAVWLKRPNHAQNSHALIGVYRLSRSKRIEICMRAMMLLPDYTFDIYGIPAELDYVKELEALIRDLQIHDRVHIHPSVPAKDLAALFTQHRLLLNMASETIDKTMLEAMTCGCYPVTTKRNADAIGITHAPEADTPEAVAAFVTEYSEKAPMNPDAMYEVVAKNHSLDALIAKMDLYIHPGT